MPGDPWIYTVIGLAVLLASSARIALERLRVPPLTGYLVIGLLLRIVDERVGLLGHDGRQVLEFVGGLGVALLLFRVGLESNLRTLLGQLPLALVVWACNVGLSALLAYATGRALLGLDPLPSLVLATAFSATSLGVSATVWEAAGAIRSKLGQLVVDVGELDDLSAVVLMVLLFALVPVVRNGGATPDEILRVLADTGVIVLIKATLFLSACVFVGRYIERPFSYYLARYERRIAPRTVAVAGLAFAIAGLAAGLGFSVAVGALFAGIVFSRDPGIVRLETSFEPMLLLFGPFFFINVGFGMDPAALHAAVPIGLVLLAAAVVGKVGGAGLPLVRMFGPSRALLFGVSMVPRAEIALFVVHEAHRVGDDLLPRDVYAGTIFVVAATCLLVPPIVRAMLAKHGA